MRKQNECESKLGKMRQVEILRGQMLLTRIMIRVMESDWPRGSKYESVHLLLDQEDFLTQRI